MNRWAYVRAVLVCVAMIAAPAARAEPDPAPCKAHADAIDEAVKSAAELLYGFEGRDESASRANMRATQAQIQMTVMQAHMTAMIAANCPSYTGPLDPVVYRSPSNRCNDAKYMGGFFHSMSGEVVPQAVACDHSRWTPAR